MEQDKDERLWKIAQKRAHFRRSLYSYLVINTFLWFIWWFSGRPFGVLGTPWPVWVMLAWGVSLAFQYYDAYQSSKSDLAEKEYEKLKKQGRL